MNTQNALLKIAGPMSPSLVLSIQKRLELLCDVPLTFRVERDETLIGGFIAFADGKVIDTSVKTQLDKMARHLSEAHTLSDREDEADA